MMEILGYIAALFIGLSLGIIGGGGSILTVPVLVYLFDYDAVVSTSMSLFIVGVSSAVGSYSYFKKGLINIKTAIIFGIPSIIAVFITRKWIVPAIPQVVIDVNGFQIEKDAFLLLLFAVLMLMASYSMIKKTKNTTKSNDLDDSQRFNYPIILLEGSIVGVLTGLVGAGGGFLIIPALVVLSKLPMKEAVGTSLAIIAAKSLIGFTGESSETLIPWPFLMLITTLAIIGIIVGSFVSKFIDGNRLKPAFGWFVLIMGFYIIIKEVWF
jgi:uncharacterized membrane protein YfcA